MATRLKEVNPDGHMEDPKAPLEKQLIDGYLTERGLDPRVARSSDNLQMKKIVAQAVQFADSQLATVECRANYVHGLHGASGK